MKKTVLVTGGAGYIGSHTCKALSKAGFLPITYDNLSTGHAYAVKWGPFIQGEIEDRTKLSETIQTYNPIAVLHFAADAIVGESMQNPAKYYRNNFAGTLSLLEAMKQNNLSSIVFSSTCATYGNPQFIPLTEEHIQSPINPYGRTKWMIEQMLKDFQIGYGMESICLRYFNAAGADPETELGENHAVETHLVPSIIQVALGIKPEIVVYGTTFDTKDGSAIRDYIHVTDLAQAHVLALQYLLATRKSDVFNLGTGVGTSVLELIEATENFLGKKLPVRKENKRPGDPALLVADNSKAKRILHWNPILSTVPQIVETAWNWHKLLLEQGPIARSAIIKLEEQKCSSSLSS